MRFGNVTGRAAMACVVAGDALQRLDRLGERAEAEHSLAVGQVRAWAGVLHHDRLPARQVAQRAIADPRVLEFHARRLGTAELAARLLNVSAVRLGAAGNLARVSHLPPVALEVGPVRCVLLGLLEAPLALRIAVEEVQRELERLARVAWQIDEVEEGHALCVIEEHGLPVSVHLQPAGRGPAGDSCEGVETGRPCSSITQDRKSTRLNSSHGYISYAVFCLKKK